MKNKLLHFLSELFAKSIWITIELIGILVFIILSPFALMAFIQDKIFYDSSPKK